MRTGLIWRDKGAERGHGRERSYEGGEGGSGREREGDKGGLSGDYVSGDVEMLSRDRVS